MTTNASVQTTDFTRDVIGRYVCNGLDEALGSADRDAGRPDGSPQSDARPFDIIIIGGGSFGAALAQHVFDNDRTHSHRVLVLEAGSFVLPEHVQNMPLLGLDVPGPIHNDPGRLRNEVWGLPWRSDDAYTGLAYCLGGRSLFFGGWSPQLLDTDKHSEMPGELWPPSVADELNQQYFAEAAEQIGTDVANDFIDGELHRALRRQLFEGINGGKVGAAIPFAELPLHLPPPKGATQAQKDALKLEAPLAVQSQAPSGLFPGNKFSSVPLLIKACRAASTESSRGVAFPDDAKKRLMVVPHCRVIRLETEVAGGAGRVTGVLTETTQTIGCNSSNARKSRVRIPVPRHAKVIIALGTIESARLALLSFQGVANYNRIGQNLMAHLRSNLTIRIPRESALHLDPRVKALQSSALFVKCRDNDTGGFFHLQITASGLDFPGDNSEAELFKKIPDLDSLEVLKRANDRTVVITIRGIGEMRPNNPQSHVRLSPETDEVGVARARVTITPNAEDIKLWEAMDRTSDEVAKVFAGGHDFEVLTPNGFVTVPSGADLRALLPYKPVPMGGRRDGLGTTHHEAGTLSMGQNPMGSATDANGRFHFVENAYALGPSLFPTVGSPNPMLTGIAMARRLGDQLTASPPVEPDPGFTLLFDGANTGRWRMSTIKNQPGRDNPGFFQVVDGALESVPGSDLGLYWCTVPMPENFILKLEWLRWREDDNSGVFLRFPNPSSKGYDNTAYVGVHFGFEVQIDQLARNDGAAIHKTGAIYDLAAPGDPDNLPVKPPGEWNEYEIHAEGQNYTVFLNGQRITQFHNTDPARGLATAPGAPSYIGLQAHTGRVAFRGIQFMVL